MKQMKPEPSTLELEIGSRKILLETGRIARQADSAVVVREGENVVLVTVVGAKAVRPDTDFFPLTVEYREKMAASGRIPGARSRREGRIGDHEILASRIIDRSIRPLFPKGYRAEVQVLATVLSAAPSGDPVSLALIGAGAALHISELPFAGPMLGMRSVIYRDKSVVLPVLAEREEATADLICSVGPHGLVMVEGNALELSGDRLLDHLLCSVDELTKVNVKIDEWRKLCGQPKRAFVPEKIDAAFFDNLQKHCADAVSNALQITGKQERHSRLTDIRDAYLLHLSGVEDSDEAECAAAPSLFHKLEKELMRRRVVEDGIRLDGRLLGEIRTIWGDHAWLPRAHGSAIFTRGETQALVSCTLGPAREAQPIETLFGHESRQILLHYNFPPYSVGETRPLRGPGRREIGHGNLAWRALSPTLPDFEDFAYTIRVESDIAESNGSSSMATVCGASLALMDAGVPIRRPVAGIAMGLIEEQGKIAILSDILGDEDHLGDMDFKVTGTECGITALQMDNKIGGLTREVLEKAFAQGLAGITKILECMSDILDGPKQDLAAHAPRVHSFRIQPHLIGAVVGPRGATIKGIQQKSGANVSVEDTGLVTIHAADDNALQKALDGVRQVAGELRIGQSYDATVMSVKDFGVFVRIYQSAEGLVHNDKLGGRRLGEGDSFRIKVTGVDGKGRLQLEPA